MKEGQRDKVGSMGGKIREGLVRSMDDDSLYHLMMQDTFDLLVASDLLREMDERNRPPPLRSSIRRTVRSIEEMKLNET